MQDIPMTKSSATLAVLITMPHSHFSEKARWALDWLSLPYREEPHAPLLHRLATIRNGGRSVPVLVHGAGRFTDSTDIPVHADSVCGGDLLYPRDSALRQVSAFRRGTRPACAALGLRATAVGTPPAS
jgi:glutathione S-transferase